MTDYPKMCFDRLLPDDINLMHTHPGGVDVARAIIVIRKMWPNGSTLHVRFMGGTAQQQQLAREQAEWWMEHANLRFEFDNAPDADIRIAFDAGNGAWSYVGTDSRRIPRDMPTMNLGFQDGGTSAHEFGHAIGLGHEHQNPAGGIQWNEEVVIRDLAGPPNFWSPDQTRHNVIRKYAHDQIRGTHFDPDSIMLYAFPGAWTVSGQGTHANEILSALDKQFIGGPDAYPRGIVPDPVEIPVIDQSGVPARIGKPGEEDMFVFKATTASRYTIETSGQTDVVMKLYGPDNRTSLLDQDDDGGMGYNSRIVANLTPGDYFVQIRHYNTTHGTGDYQIKVTK
ncbi:MAG: M12 family metallopeptidase [Desulfobacterales bacterium]|nr:M12 family metallopeptidase [Desulfobacterales bacterium]